MLRTILSNIKRASLLVAMGSIALTACMDGDWDTPASIAENPPYGNNDIEKYADSRVTTVNALKQKYATTIKGSKCVQITDDLQLQVVVCGNDLGGNIYKQLAVQDATGGIIVGINATDLCAYLPVGQKLLINLKGLYIGGYGTQAQIGALYNGSLGRMDADTWEQHVRLVEDSWVDAVADTIDFVAGADQLLQTGRIVRIAAATVTGTGTQTLAPDDGTVSLTSNCANRIINGNSKLLLRTSTYSDFASLPIPGGKVDIYGVCTIFNGSWQILMRTESDLQTSR